MELCAIRDNITTCDRASITDIIATIEDVIIESIVLLNDITLCLLHLCSCLYVILSSSCTPSAI